MVQIEKVVVRKNGTTARVTAYVRDAGGHLVASSRDVNLTGDRKDRQAAVGSHLLQVAGMDEE